MTDYINDFDPLAWAGKNNKETQAKKQEQAQRAARSNEPTSGVGQRPTADGEDHRRRMPELAVEVIRMGKDITDDYGQWLELGFALVDGMGEAGRQVFHDLSRMSQKYDPVECDKKYDECLKSYGRSSHPVTAKTFYHLVKQAGVDIRENKEVSATLAKWPCGTSQSNISNLNNMKSFDEIRPAGQLAEVAKNGTNNSWLTFSDKLKKEDIPTMLAPVIESQTDAVGVDKMLLGALNLFSGLLPSALYSIYDRRKVYAALYNIIYGGYATSKGDLEACRKIVSPVKQEMRRKYEAEKQQYEEELARWNSKNKRDRGPAPVEPEFRTPIVPANSSASAVYRCMAANGGWGLMYETEADVLTNMLSKNDYGDNSALLRNAHHHETISMDRVTDHLHIEIDEPRLSVFLTCTGSQLPLLLPPGNVANGLASRFLFYALPPNNVEFRNVFANQDQPLEDIFADLGQRFLPLYHELLQRQDKPIQFVMSKAQQEEFLSTFNAILREQYGMMGEGIQGFVYRLALECYRYSMVLTALRRLSDWNQLDDIFEPDEVALPCDDRDFHTAMTIINCLVNHTARVYAVLATKDDDPFNNTTEQPTQQQREYYQALPVGEVKTSAAMDIAKRLHIASRTARRMLGEFVSRFQVLGHPQQGVYVKPEPTTQPADEERDPSEA